MKRILFLTIIVFLAITASSGCRKKKDTLAKIYVEDSDGATVDNAMVILYGTNTTTIPQLVTVFDTSYTNVDGVATFNFNDIYQLGQAGVAVLDIKALKLNLVGEGIIKIEAEKTVEETVILY